MPIILRIILSLKSVGSRSIVDFCCRFHVELIFCFLRTYIITGENRRSGSLAPSRNSAPPPGSNVFIRTLSRIYAAISRYLLRHYGKFVFLGYFSPTFVMAPRHNARTFFPPPILLFSVPSASVAFSLLLILFFSLPWCNLPKWKSFEMVTNRFAGNGERCIFLVSSLRSYFLFFNKFEETGACANVKACGKKIQQLVYRTTRSPAGRKNKGKTSYHRLDVTRMRIIINNKWIFREIAS